MLRPCFEHCYVGAHMGARLGLHPVWGGKHPVRHARIEERVVLCVRSWWVWVPEEDETGKGGRVALFPVAEARDLRGTRF